MSEQDQEQELGYFWEIQETHFEESAVRKVEG
jgi:hypothetical protein